MDDKIIKDNFTEVDDGKYVTTGRESCYTITTRPRDMPLHKKQDNFVLEKCVGSPRPHASKTTGDISPCLTSNNYGSSSPILQFKNDMNSYKIRRLTPKECERLQGFPDDWTKFGKDGELISDTQRYKCCGNAVTTNVITAIVNQMFKDV